MKKGSSVLVAGLLACALAGCAQPPVIDSTASAEPQEADGYQACLMTDASDDAEGGPAQQALDGLDRAKTELGVQINPMTAESSADYPQVLQTLVDSDCSVIIALGSGTADSTQAAAKANPGVQFALVDAIPNSAPANLRTVIFSTHESSFLAGYAAAASSSSGKVGVFGALSVPAVTIYMDGFVQGVDYYNDAKDADVEALGWSLDSQNGTFVRSDSSPYEDASAGQAAAESLTDDGADVIMAVAGKSGEGALQLAESDGKTKVIWTETDGCLTEADYCGQQLGSVVKVRGAAIYELIKTDQEGRSSSGAFTASLRNEATAFVPSSSADLATDLSKELDDIAAKIVDGSITVTSPSAIG